MAMACYKCQLVYDEGQVCPNCGGYLAPYYPQPLPTPQPAYEQPPVEPDASYEAVTSPVTPTSGSKGKTIAIILLSALVAALTALCIYLLTHPAPEPEVVERVVEVEAQGPSDVEAAVVDSGWEVLSVMWKATPTLDEATDPDALASLTATYSLLSEGTLHDVVCLTMISMSAEHPYMVEAFLNAMSSLPHVSEEGEVVEVGEFALMSSRFCSYAKSDGFDTSEWDVPW